MYFFFEFLFKIHRVNKSPLAIVRGVLTLPCSEYSLSRLTVARSLCYVIHYDLEMLGDLMPDTWTTCWNYSDCICEAPGNWSCVSQIINNSSSVNKGNHDGGVVATSDLQYQYRYFTIIFLRFLLSFSFDWEDTSNTQDRVWPYYQTPRSSYVFSALSPRCLEIWSNTVFRVSDCIEQFLLR